MANVKIVMSGHGRGEVFIDGHRIECVYAVEFNARTNERNEVCLTLIPKAVEIEGPADVVEAPMAEVATMADSEPQHVPAEPPGAE